MIKPKRAAPPSPPSIDELAAMLREPAFYMHCHFRSAGFDSHKSKPADRPTLAIVEIGGWQYTVTFDDTRGHFVSPPPVYFGIGDWTVVGRLDGTTYFRRPKKPPPPPPPPLVGPGEISNAEFRKRMGINDD